MWWLLPIAFIGGIITTLFVCSKIANHIQKQADDIEIYQNVNLLLWCEYAGQRKQGLEVTWDLSQWTQKGIMMCHVVYDDEMLRSMPYATAEAIRNSDGTTWVMLQGVTVYQWGGLFNWEY